MKQAFCRNSILALLVLLLTALGASAQSLERGAVQADRHPRQGLQSIGFESSQIVSPAQQLEDLEAGERGDHQDRCLDDSPRCRQQGKAPADRAEA